MSKVLTLSCRIKTCGKDAMQRHPLCQKLLGVFVLLFSWTTNVSNIRRMQMNDHESETKPPKVAIVSHPKSGRSWLRVLIGKALCEHSGLDDQLIFDKDQLAKATGVPKISYTHEDSGNSERKHYQKLQTDKSQYKKKKVIFLIRDPRDVLVSYYFHVSRRSDLFHGSISEFLRSDVYGVRKIVTFYNIWHANIHVPQALLLLRYEELHADPKGKLGSVLDFIGADRIADGIVQKAVEFASFSNMKKLEETRHFLSKKLQPGKSEDEDSYKVRRGVVGGYRDDLSLEDCRYINGVIQEMDCAFFPTKQ